MGIAQVGLSQDEALVNSVNLFLVQMFYLACFT